MAIADGSNSINYLLVARLGWLMLDSLMGLQHSMADLDMEYSYPLRPNWSQAVIVFELLKYTK